MNAADFIHLRVHTAYSLSEGALRIKALAQLCRELQMPAVAMTDTNNLFGAMDFCQTLRLAGVQPIIGCQLTVETGGPARVAVPVPERPGSPRDGEVVVLVQNEAGYRNLLCLLATAHADGVPGPRLAPEHLRQHAQGLILLTGGPGGPVGRLLRDGRDDQARGLLSMLAEAFADRLYVEIQRHGLAEEAATEAAFLELAARLSLPLVATNDVYFATPDLHEAHDVLLCIAEGVTVGTTERRRVTVNHYFRSAAEMAEVFADLPDAIANTALIARRCGFILEPAKPMFPAFDCGAAGNAEQLLRQQAVAGLAERLRPGAETQGDVAAAYRERLDYELGVICSMGFASYFLVVAEFIQWAKAQGIPVGPGRGSGAGSVVAWALKITDLDPIRFGLLFERFLNPERVSMPDFDIDFCQDRRDEVIQHVRERYGSDRVAQIITFGKLQARAVLRDVGRALALPFGFVDRICKLIPNNPAHPVTLDQAIEAEPQLQEMARADPAVRRLIDLARPLEGLYRHASTHAAGVVIADRPLVELIPLYRDPRSPAWVTGFNMKWVEAAGLVKFDFLGLKTLTVLTQAVELVRLGRTISLDLAALPLDDAKTFELLGKGDTVGVFQLESAGMRDVLHKLKPDSFEDIIAVVALYRPGPMDNIPSYIRRKHGEEEPDYLHPSLEPILRETHGIMIYQEQVMQIAQCLAGYSLGGADILRRAMGKKIKEEMDQQRDAFIDGARARGVAQSKAAQVFDLVAKFAGYGFNKSHAAAYALVAYQTAYMKANYPLEFFAASMSLDIGNSDKLNGYRQELDRLGLALLPPDVNRSQVTFSVDSGGADASGPRGIRYALAAVKTVSAATVAPIVAERQQRGPFRSLEDFARRLDGRQINRRQLENLAKAGAFDAINPNRRQVVEALEPLLRLSASMAADAASGQMGLFGAGGSDAAAAAVPLPAVEDWLPLDRLREELDAIGFYLSAHPLDAYASKLQRLNVTRSAALTAGPVTLAGTVIGRRERTSGKGMRYAFVQLSDPTGVFEVTVFAELLAARRDILEVGRSVLIRATAQVDGDNVRCVAQEIEPIEQALSRLGSMIEICIGGSAPIAAIRDVLTAYESGRDSVRLIGMLEDGLEVVIALPARYAIAPDAWSRLQQIRGVEAVRLG
jgi:DNA polymerase-3 subunit alpha